MSAQPTPRPWAAFTTGSEGCSVTARDVRVPRVARLTSAPLETCQADAALIVAAVNDYDRLLAVEAAAREIVALLLTSGKEPPPLNDSGLMSTLAFYAGPNARTAVDSREAARVTALGAAASALRAALARPAEEERG